MSTDNQTRKAYRTIGHQLNPVVIVKELTANVAAEIDRALNDHELIKVKIIADREGKKQLIADICDKLGAELIQQTGHIALLFRAAAKPNPALSNLQRHLKK